MPRDRCPIQAGHYDRGMIDLAGKRVTVMGLGRFGGGIGVTRWLCARGADVLVTDKDGEADLADSVAQIGGLVGTGQVRLRLGEHNVSDFTDTDLVVANAAVPKPWDNRYLRAAEAGGVPITTEISLTVGELVRRGAARTVGITGSAGKSTTTAMIHHALTAVLGPKGQKVVMGGNIGGSLLGEMESIGPGTIVVLELSSAQLYWLGRTVEPRWSPRVAVVTNLSANHLDWHGDFGHYGASKRSMLEGQRAGDVAVLGAGVWAWREGTRARAVMVEPGSISVRLRLPGEHNRFNAAAALEACMAVAPEADRGALLGAIADFGGLAHRLQLVDEVPAVGGDGAVRFYNDSKSTTPESALKAVEAIAGAEGGALGRIHLIAGGYDKGSDLSPIARLAGELAGLYTIGATGRTLAELAGGAGGAGDRVHACETLGRAFGVAASRARGGDVVLLSPGCASWDQYVNFEARGDEFVALVKAQAGAGVGR